MYGSKFSTVVDAKLFTMGNLAFLVPAVLLVDGRIFLSFYLN